MDVLSRHAHELYLYKASRTQPAASCKPASPFTLSMPNREPTKKMWSWECRMVLCFSAEYFWHVAVT